MGTRSLTRFTEDKKVFCCIYRQFDGYPNGHGAELAKILRPMKVVNGYGFGDKAGKTANGMGCLAAQVIGRLKRKHGLGGIYVESPDTKDCGEEYVYTVSDVAGVPHIHVASVSGFEKTRKLRKLWSGPANEFKNHKFL